MTGEERLDIALTGIPDDIAPDLEAKRGAWNVCSYVLVKMLDGLGDLAPNRFTYVFSYDDSERYEISVHRVRGESQLAALEKSNAALEQALEAVDRLTAERNETAGLRDRIAYLEAGLGALVRHNAGTGACLPDCITNTDDAEDCNCGYMAAEDPGGFAADLLSGAAEVISERGTHEGAAEQKP